MFIDELQAYIEYQVKNIRGDLKSNEVKEVSKKAIEYIEGLLIQIPKK